MVRSSLRQSSHRSIRQGLCDCTDRLRAGEEGLRVCEWAGKLLFLPKSIFLRHISIQVNVDEGWLKGRYPGNNTIYEDITKFPSGMAALGQWVRSQPTYPGSPKKMKYGLYSCRGTCQCGTHYYGAVGSHGFEAEDTAWMIAAGAEWLKIDSCCGSQDHATAFSDYSKFRDAMNASGKQVWFNLCGWHDWYAPPDLSINYTGGGSLGNSWRIYGDGGSFRAITGALNTMARLSNFTGPGAYSDPDNILGPHGTVGRVSESQARVQVGTVAHTHKT